MDAALNTISSVSWLETISARSGRDGLSLAAGRSAEVSTAWELMPPKPMAEIPARS